MANKPSSFILFVAAGQVLVLPSKLFNEFFQIFPLRMRFNLDNPCVGSVEIRVSTVGHRPIKEIVHCADIEIEVLGRLHYIVNISLTWKSLLRDVIEVQRPLMEENGIKFFNRKHASVVSGKASRLRALVVIKGLPSKSQVIFFASIRLIPKQDVFNFRICRIFLSKRIKSQSDIFPEIVCFYRVKQVTILIP